MNKIIRIFLLAVLLLSAGCQRKPLMEPHEHYNLIIKAQIDSLGRAQLMSNKSDYAALGTPASTTYYLYDKGTGRVAYFGDFDGLEKRMYVEEGYYDLLLYTYDFNPLVDANEVRGLGNPLTAETFTRQYLNSEDKSDEAVSDVTELYMVDPDPTFSAFHEDIVVLRHDEDNIVQVDLVQKSFKYYLTIRATGLQHIRTATMHISGMYTTAFLAHEDHRMNEAGIQSIDMDIHQDTDPDPDIDNGYLYGEFWSFGPHQREDIINSITLQFVNGEVFMRQLDDLTDHIKTLDKGGEIIVNQILEVTGPAGGFELGVGNWNQTDVELIM